MGSTLDFLGATIADALSPRFRRPVEDIIYEKGFQFHGFRMTDLPEGMYIVRLVTQDRDKIYRIVKY